jgi:hypothetical protein
MIRKGMVAFALSLLVSSVSFAENWVYIGEDRIEGEEVTLSNWLDVDSVIPVAELNGEGKAVLLPFTYKSKYKFAFSDDPDRVISSEGIVNLEARKYLTFSDDLNWKFDMYGADGFYFNAYLIKNFEKIHQREPFLIKGEYVLRDTQTEWPIDPNGWKQVYQRDMMGVAWIQTKSVQLSSMEGDELPRVRVLVRYYTGGGKPLVYYSYVEYNPATHSRKVLGNWDQKWKPLTGKKVKDDFYFLSQASDEVDVLSPDAAIATEAYMPFVLDRTLIQSRPVFDDKEDKNEIPADWKNFSEESR